jgi:cAMP phosphodiesterase
MNRLNYISVINCKNRHGKYSKGRKVTGIHLVNNSVALITTADSRLRLLNLNVLLTHKHKDFSQKRKYKGHVNTEVQMVASINEDEEFVICGSEDGKLCIWNKVSQYAPAINPM